MDRTQPLAGCRRWGGRGEGKGEASDHNQDPLNSTLANLNSTLANLNSTLANLNRTLANLNGLGSLVPPSSAPPSCRRFLAAERPGAGTGARRKGGRETRPCTGLA